MELFARIADIMLLDLNEILMEITIATSC